MTTPPGRGATPREVAQAHGRSAAVHYEVRFKEALSQEGALNASSGEPNEARAAALFYVMREAVNDGLAGGLQGLLEVGGLEELEQCVWSERLDARVSGKQISKRPWFSLVLEAEEAARLAEQQGRQNAEEYTSAGNEVKQLRQQLDKKEAEIEKTRNDLEAQAELLRSKNEELETSLRTERKHREESVANLRKQSERHAAEAKERAAEVSFLREQASRVERAETAFSALRARRREGSRSSHSLKLATDLQGSLMELRNARLSQYDSALAGSSPSTVERLRYQFAADAKELVDEIDALEHHRESLSLHTSEAPAGAVDQGGLARGNGEEEKGAESDDASDARAKVWHGYFARAKRAGWRDMTPRLPKRPGFAGLCRIIESVLQDAADEEHYGRGLPNLHRCFYSHLDRIYRVPSVVLLVAHGSLKELEEARKGSALCEFFWKAMADELEEATTLIAIEWRRILQRMQMDSPADFSAFLRHAYQHGRTDELERIESLLEAPASKHNALECLHSQLAQRDDPGYWRWKIFLKGRDSRRSGSFNVHDLVDIASTSAMEPLQSIARHKIDSALHRAAKNKGSQHLTLDSAARVLTLLELRCVDRDLVADDVPDDSASEFQRPSIPQSLSHLSDGDTGTTREAEVIKR